jgi:hypothetical protein
MLARPEISFCVTFAWAHIASDSIASAEESLRSVIVKEAEDVRWPTTCGAISLSGRLRFFILSPVGATRDPKLLARRPPVDQV